MMLLDLGPPLGHQLLWWRLLVLQQVVPDCFPFGSVGVVVGRGGDFRQLWLVVGRWVDNLLLLPYLSNHHLMFSLFLILQ